MKRVLIISSGFQGGKIHLSGIVKYIKSGFVILENEYASLNVDEDILKERSELSVWELTEKCHMLHWKDDFTLNTYNCEFYLAPEYLIVEPGVGYLSNVINNISQIEYEQIEPLAPITIVDPNKFFEHMRKYQNCLPTR